MAVDREIRRLQNIKEIVIPSGDTKSTASHAPSALSMNEGEMVFAQAANGQVALYKKHKGLVWRTNLSKDGNQFIDKNLEVKGSSIIGDSLGIGEYNVEAPLHITASDNTAAIIIEENHSTGGAEFTFRSSDGLTNASATSDFLGGLLWQGWDGDSFEYGAQIRARPEATWSGSSRSTKLEFMTTPTDSTTIATVLTLDNGGAATFTSTVQADNFKSSDGSAGITATHDFNDAAGVTHTVVIKDGLITSWSEVSS